jgi:nitrile hydratase subunit beta
MNGAQDMGGQMGHGPVSPEPDEPVFHAAWERRALALTLAMGACGAWNLDQSRHARESLPPAVYLNASYYEIWIRALESLLVGRGLVGADELAQGRAIRPGGAVSRVLMAEAVPAVLAAGTPYDRPGTAQPMFHSGDRVRARNDHVATHTRLPRYVRGCTGVIAANQGCFVLPDANAHGRGECATWCYSVRFTADELWGAGAEAGSEVMVDLWEPYLERA